MHQKRSVRKLLSGRTAIIIIAAAASLLLAHERLHKQRKMQRQPFCCWPLQVWAPEITEQKIKQKSRLIAACSLAPSRPPSAQNQRAAAMTMVRTTTRWWWQWRYCAEHQTRLQQQGSAVSGMVAPPFVKTKFEVIYSGSVVWSVQEGQGFATSYNCV